MDVKVIEIEDWQSFMMGDIEALGRIYSRHIDALYQYGMQFTSNKSQVKDSIQDVFHRLIDDRKKIGQARSVKAYLMACLRRKLLLALEAERKSVDLPIENHEAFQIKVDASAYFLNSSLTLDQKKILEHHYNALPVRQREMIIMRFFEDMPYEEIA
ncbi:hypothetical protein GCM10007049_21030 [Echinicola pacifica]|uniref:RNA polymerase sigma factor, sigma-70 family n=1 Tax=Echinicola pacifica TaxID=346377 RepID=A0A918UQC7_9BACT|nr:sigma-70 family RNA polymerase sigma factor [Echinicola pacifica]GGZ27942.1 hypothetical protein GCM10007049_21030 [Echinicola pacifica]